MAHTREVSENVPPEGKVGKVVNDWLVHTDGAMAHHMQNDEFEYKYGLNRFNRRTARGDVPVAKVAQTEEEKRLELQQLQRLEEAKRIADQDAILAEQLMRDLAVEDGQQRVAVEKNDRALASEMQQVEELDLQKRLLKKQQRRLQRSLDLTSREANQELQNYAKETDPSLNAQKLLRSDNRVEDLGDFSDFYIQPSAEMAPQERAELQALQDEELARLIQEQEHKRGAQLNMDKIKAIEEQDAELARVMQEQEKLRLEKAKHRKQQRHLSHPGDSAASQQPTVHTTLPAHWQSRRAREQGSVSPQGQDHSSEYANLSPFRSLSVPGTRDVTPEQNGGGGARAIKLPGVGRLSPNSGRLSPTMSEDSSGPPMQPPPPPPGHTQPVVLKGMNSRTNAPPVPTSPRPSETGSTRPGAPISTNVFTAIDPTSQRRDVQPDPAMLGPRQHTLPARPPATASESPSEGGEDIYYELPENENDLVQGERRVPSVKKDKKSPANKQQCKQQ